MKRSITCVIAVVALAALFSGCMPIYDMAGGDSIGMDTSVIMDGVTYEMVPDLKWRVNPGHTLGYAGSRSIKILDAEGDTERNFICLMETSQFWDKHYAVLCRTDYPEPSAETITRIEYYGKDGGGQEIHSIITDLTVIKELFDALENGKQEYDISRTEDFQAAIYCTSDDVPGATYVLGIIINDGRLMCGSHEEGYVEISDELFKKITGTNAG